MKKSVVLSLAVCVMLAALAGCAGTKKVSPEELVMQRTHAFVNDLLAAKADTILDYVSDTFTNEHVADKATLADHLKKAKEKGQVADFPNMIKEHNGQIEMKDAKVKVEKDTATVYPIIASANEGSVTVELIFKKDPDKVWRISAINIEGI